MDGFYNPEHGYIRIAPGFASMNWRLAQTSDAKLSTNYKRAGGDGGITVLPAAKSSLISWRWVGGTP